MTIWMAYILSTTTWCVIRVRGSWKLIECSFFRFVLWVMFIFFRNNASAMYVNVKDRYDFGQHCKTTSLKISQKSFLVIETQTNALDDATNSIRWCINCLSHMKLRTIQSNPFLMILYSSVYGDYSLILSWDKSEVYL
jgi:hypothetical protein